MQTYWTSFGRHSDGLLWCSTDQAWHDLRAKHGNLVGKCDELTTAEITWFDRQGQDHVVNAISCQEYLKTSIAQVEVGEGFIRIDTIENESEGRMFETYAVWRRGKADLAVWIPLLIDT